jgi:hypothetical protein
LYSEFSGIEEWSQDSADIGKTQDILHFMGKQQEQIQAVA